MTGVLSDERDRGDGGAAGRMPPAFRRVLVVALMMLWAGTGCSGDNEAEPIEPRPGVSTSVPPTPGVFPLPSSLFPN